MLARRFLSWECIQRMDAWVDAHWHGSQTGKRAFVRGLLVVTEEEAFEQRAHERCAWLKRVYCPSWQ